MPYTDFSLQILLFLHYCTLSITEQSIHLLNHLRASEEDDNGWNSNQSESYSDDDEDDDKIILIRMRQTLHVPAILLAKWSGSKIVSLRSWV